MRISIQRHYYKVCLAQQQIYKDLDKQITSLKEAPSSQDEMSLEEINRNLDKQHRYYEQREQAAVIVITFAGMCLEAFLYDYAATHLGDAYVKHHLDKLDLKSKLLIFPRLICGKAIEKSSEVYAKVTQLARDRNHLVHFKSIDTEVEKASDVHDDLNERFKKAMTNGVEAIELVMKELDALHGRPGYFYNLVCK